MISPDFTFLASEFTTDFHMYFLISRSRQYSALSSEKLFICWLAPGSFYAKNNSTVLLI